MKKNHNVAGICCLGLAVASGVFWIGQKSGDKHEQTVPVHFVSLPAKSAIREFEWRQPLLHPTYPPKLVKGEKEFVLK